MPNNLPRLEKAIKRIIWEQKHKAPNESQNYVQWLHKIDVFFTCLTAIASVGSLLGIAFYYGLNKAAWSPTKKPDASFVELLRPNRMRSQAGSRQKLYSYLR